MRLPVIGGLRWKALRSPIHEQALAASTDGPLLVVEARIGEADTSRLGNRARVEAHPLADRKPVEVYREVRIDEQLARVVERHADAVARVGCREHALDRRRHFAGDDRRK